MLDRRVIQLTREIRDLYARSCLLADQYNGRIIAEQQALREVCRGRPSRVPELNYFPDVFDRQAALRRALEDPGVRARSGALHAAAAFVAVGVLWRWVLTPGAFGVLLALAVLLAVTAALLHQRLIVGGARVRRLLREQLVARGVPICVGCGYDLRGQVEPRCPECGRAAAAATSALGEACHVN